MIAEQAVTLAAGDGTLLEARLAVPDAPAGGIVICHPHPLYGGDMDNPVVVRAAEVCAAMDFATLRFNFRGVGASTGTHGGGEAEQRDVEAALDRLTAMLPAAAPLVLAGYSFGAAVAARVAAHRTGLAGLVLIAPPLALGGSEPYLGLRGRGLPVLLVAGSRDEYCPRAALEALAAGLPAAALELVERADHFFFGRLFPLGEALGRWIRALEARQAGRGGGTG
jgi:hypothetical protein